MSAIKICRENNDKHIRYAIKFRFNQQDKTMISLRKSVTTCLLYVMTSLLTPATAWDEQYTPAGKLRDLWGNIKPYENITSSDKVAFSLVT